jgi:hypothetical protein
MCKMARVSAKASTSPWKNPSTPPERGAWCRWGASVSRSPSRDTPLLSGLVRHSLPRLAAPALCADRETQPVVHTRPDTQAHG